MLFSFFSRSYLLAQNSGSAWPSWLRCGNAAPVWFLHVSTFAELNLSLRHGIFDHGNTHASRQSLLSRNLPCFASYNHHLDGMLEYATSFQLHNICTRQVKVPLACLQPSRPQFKSKTSHNLSAGCFLCLMIASSKHAQAEKNARNPNLKALKPAQAQEHAENAKPRCNVSGQGLIGLGLIGLDSCIYLCVCSFVSLLVCSLACVFNCVCLLA